MNRLASMKLGNAQRRSPELQLVLSNYSQYLLAHIAQSVACNAAHSIKQRTAKWVVEIIEQSGTEKLAITHEQLAAVLGIGRSYASRVIQGLKADGLLSTARSELRVQNLQALKLKSCHCNDWLQKALRRDISGCDAEGGVGVQLKDAAAEAAAQSSPPVDKDGTERRALRADQH